MKRPRTAHTMRPAPAAIPPIAAAARPVLVLSLPFEEELEWEDDRDEVGFEVGFEVALALALPLTAAAVPVASAKDVARVEPMAVR